MTAAGKLTFKQKIFADSYIKTGNGTQSALKIYNVKNKSVARQIGSENLTKPYIKSYIENAIKKSGYNPVKTLNHLQSTEEKGYRSRATVKDALHASEILLKLSGMLIEKSQSVSINANIDNLDTTDLLILKKKYDKLLEDK